MIYEIIQLQPSGQIIKGTAKDGKEYFIPFQESNSDYQAYLNPKQNEGILN